MFNMTKTLTIGALAGVGLAGLAAANSGWADQAGEIGRCEIRQTDGSAMVTLEGVIHANTEITGSYSFHVVNAGRSGSANIQQGGAFRASAGQTLALGKVMLGGSAADYDATLTVDANGATLTCENGVGGVI